MTPTLSIASLPDVDAVAREDEPVRPLPTPKPRPRVAGPWHDAGGVLVRKCGRNVVAQVIYRGTREYGNRAGYVEQYQWITEGAAGFCVLRADARDRCDQELRRRKWRLE